MAIERKPVAPFNEDGTPSREFLSAISNASDKAAAGWALEHAWKWFGDQVSALTLKLSVAQAEIDKLQAAARKRDAARLLVSVERELAAAGAAGAGSLAEGARAIAAALDQYTAIADSAAELSAIVKAHQELRVTLAQIREDASRAKGVAGSEVDGSDLSTPVRNAP